MVKEKMGKGKLRGCVNGVRSKLHSLRPLQNPRGSLKFKMERRRLVAN